MKIFIGADHRGFRLKEELKPWLISQGHQVEDKGAYQLDPDDDFPDFAAAVSQTVVSAPESIGILICGSGSGMAIVANKFKGVYAVVANDENALYTNGGYGVNLLAFPADLNLEKAKGIINKQISAQFEIKESYQRRLQKISDIETQNFK